LTTKSTGNGRVTPKKEPDETQALTFDVDSMTFREGILFEEIAGRSLMELGEEIDMRTALAFCYITQRRIDPDADLEELKDSPIMAQMAGMTTTGGNGKVEDGELGPTNASG